MILIIQYWTIHCKTYYHELRRTRKEWSIMYERTNASVKPRLLGIEEFMAYTSLGRGSALKLDRKLDVQYGLENVYCMIRERQISILMH